MKATEAAPGCIPKLWVVSPSLRSEGGEGRGEAGRQLCQASPLPNPLPVRLAALARERSGRGEGEAACGLRPNQQLRDARHVRCYEFTKCRCSARFILAPASGGVGAGI